MNSKHLTNWPWPYLVIIIKLFKFNPNYRVKKNYPDNMHDLIANTRII